MRPDLQRSGLGDYELLTPIGVGGMGSVYAARREVVSGVQRLFAIKLLHPPLQADPSFARQLLEEARIAATIRDPHVVAVVEAAESEGRVFLVMDYVEGGTLAALMRKAYRDKAPLPLPIVGRILADALEGLRAAHETRAEDGTPLELVHRDFSPQNLLVGVDGMTRLTDFGIAKAVRRDSVTTTGQIKGKIGYMAPEQALGQPLDARCDVWAAGVVLWEAMTGRRLWSADNDATMLLELVSGAPPSPPSLYRSGITPAIDALVERALQRDRDARMPGAGPFRAALLEAWRDIGVADAAEVGSFVKSALALELDERRREIERTATRGPIVTSAVTSRSGRRAPIAAVAAVGLVSVAGAMLVMRPWDASAPRAPAASLVTPTPTGTSAPSASEASPWVLRIEANEPIAELQIDDREPVVLLEAQKIVRLPLDPNDTAARRRLRASTRDGRAQLVELSGTEREIVLRFPPRPPPIAPAIAPAAPRPPAHQPKVLPDDDQLAPAP
jgi:eukaryotic-like serine/threonine-protein kinase